MCEQSVKSQRIVGPRVFPNVLPKLVAYVWLSFVLPCDHKIIKGIDPIKEFIGCMGVDEGPLGKIINLYIHSFFYGALTPILDIICL
jgi:hypothetical protein